MIRPPTSRTGRLWRQWVRPLAVVILTLSALRSAVADWYVVPTGSMKPTIVEGDRILVNKLAYDLKLPFTTWHLAEWAEPQRGDVVVFYAPGSGVRMVKRVVGLPGDRLELRNNRLILNGRPIDCEPASQPDSVWHSRDGESQVLLDETLSTHPHQIMTTPQQPARRWFGPLVVGQNEYFMMGDNRDNSRDSRWFGCVSRERILGRSSRIAISLDASNYYLPRWNRFLRPL